MVSNSVNVAAYLFTSIGGLFMNKRAHISLKPQTKEVLTSIRATGQSFDGIIQQLLEFWTKQSEKTKAHRSDGINSKRV